jgi:hypothetical protein
LTVLSISSDNTHTQMQGHKDQGIHKGNALFMLDYYQRPFHLLHQENARRYRDFTKPHSIRGRFWQLVPHGEYPSEKGRVFLSSYLIAIEAELAREVRKLSLAYCLHLYRRLAPGPIGKNQQPRTIGLTRAVLEAAIQKYARFQLCDKIAESSSVGIEKVLSGLLMAPEFEVERKIIAQGNQLVLTDFANVDLLAFYDLERLAYEIWRTAAALRTTGKGSPLIVCDSPECFIDGRSPELDFLVTTYDQRLDKSGLLSRSASGVVFSEKDEMSAAGFVFLPAYNLGGVVGKDYAEILSEMFGMKLGVDISFNFACAPFNLREYREAHLPFATSFCEKYRVSLDAVLAVVAALLEMVFCSWYQTGITAFVKFHQRAYEGPHSEKFILDSVMSFIPVGCKALGIHESVISSDEIKEAIKFWKLDVSNRADIDLSYSGPHYLFLPVQDDYFFIDYAWIYRRLHDLFVGIWIPDQNFKGEALEHVVRRNKSILPAKPCRSDSGERRQIDYAAECGSHLIIAECKAVGRSIAFDRGDPQAIEYRTNNVIERGLSEVDDKAKWLAAHPLGINYDLSDYGYILPVVVSPFVEFIPSQDEYYWISRDIPRILTPKEFQKLLNDPAVIMNAFNRIRLH